MDSTNGIVNVQRRVYTRQEVSLHDKDDDCWIVVGGRVYDVTQWMDSHPGGRAILKHHGGEDATVSNTLDALSSQRFVW